jgi:hypothetical protein
MPYSKYYKYLTGKIKKPRTTLYRHKLITNLNKNSIKNNYKAHKDSAYYSKSSLNDNLKENVVEDDESSDTTSITDFIFESIKDDFNNQDLCAAYLCLFYSGGLNKTQLEKILELNNLIFTDKILPKSFNDCAKELLNKMEDTINYNKKWYCRSCKIFINLDKPSQRTCHICSKM